jgi:hypothetical protein
MHTLLSERRLTISCGLTEALRANDMIVSDEAIKDELHVLLFTRHDTTASATG